MKKRNEIRKIITLSTLVLVAFSSYAQIGMDWTSQVGGVNSEDSQSIVVDANGNVFTMGLFEGTVDFDPSGAVVNLTSVGGDDIYLSKTDANGNLLWAKSFGGSSNEFAGTIAIDLVGDVYLTGSARNTVDFDPGVAVYNLTCDFYDAFITKISGSGNFQWAKIMGGSSIDFSTDVAIDGSGNIFVVGRFQSTADFNLSGTAALLTSLGSNDAFVVKYNSSGNFIWVKQIGGTDYDVITSVSISNNGDLILAGSFKNTVDFDPSTGTTSVISNGNADLFICKWSNAGAFSWVKSFGGSSSEYLSEAIEDNLGNIYATGRFQSVVDFDTGSGVFNITPISSQDAFITKLNSLGSFLWAKNFGGTGISLGNGLALDPASNIYTFGHFQNTVDFDPNVGITNTTSNGGSDAFLTKLDPSGNLVWVETFGGTGAEQARALFLDASSNIYITGNFETTVDFDPTSLIFNLTSSGGSDAYVSKFIPCANSTSTLNISTCGSYVSPSGVNTWNTSGTYYDTLLNTGGCDSIITIVLTVNSAATATNVITACDSYTWIDNITYTNDNNTATHTIVGGAGSGCDSIITLNLTIINVDASTTQTSSVITANNNSATNYQWIDCNNNSAILAGETGVSYAPSINGTYAVIVYEGSCSDTSSCISVTSVGVESLGDEFQILVYPNPTSGTIIIDSDNVVINQMKVYSALGVLVYENLNIQEVKSQIDLEIPNGVYFVQVESEGKLRTIKLIVK